MWSPRLVLVLLIAALLQVVLVHSATATWSKAPKYAVPDMPVGLQANAHAVIRAYTQTVTVRDETLVTQQVTRAITVLSKAGQREARLRLYYNKFTTIASLSARVYDQQGNMIKRLPANSFEDHSAFSGSTLYSDNRIKTYLYETGTYPYTIEYQYTVQHRGTLFLPGWNPVPGEKVSVEQASFTVQFPKSNPVRYWERNLPQARQSSEDAQHQRYTWTATQLHWQEPEPYGPAGSALNPSVRLALTRFQMDGYAGSNQSWESISAWYHRLNKGRDQLSDEARAAVQKLLAGVSDPREKVALLYQYMQQNTRYVSIQLGIGGWQTVEATKVEEKGYGDCKALTNFTKALLKEAGIAAHEAIIYAGDRKRKVNQAFPSSQFNHVILCVPLAEDTLWLECTSQTNPMGYLGSFTGDRYALLVKPAGGGLVRTPALTAAQNLQKRVATLTFSPLGDAQVQVVTSYEGRQYENNNLQYYLHEGPDKQREWLYETLDLPSFEIRDFSFADQPAQLPRAVETLHLQLNNYASVSGKRLFFKPNLLNQWRQLPPPAKDRKQNLVRTFGFTDQDSVTVLFPEGYHAEFLPEPIVYQTEFGRYEVRFEQQEDGISYTRLLQMQAGEYPPEAYARYRDFIKAIVKGDKAKVIMLKST